MTQALKFKRANISVIIMAMALFSSPISSMAETALPQTSSVVHLNAGEAKVLLEQGTDIQILDVRTKSEYKRGHIDGALNINYFSFKFKKKLRALNRDVPYLVHCKSGHRSSGAVKVMRREGFKVIYHMDGGYDAWKKLPAKTLN